ncbi:Facilitated trehalose transporter Tret1 [Frankliniella fusca]|uniref:Facilitated trehalose transporter Tret1 n=1 Tax=Frankliniella fusca TaxID=407009 RepID=A0AAE1H0G3_9NEOP|nr:Facilitated trehalose transporter Tret1 [Frankliniella fusca]
MTDLEKGKAAEAAATKARTSSVFHRHAPPPTGPKNLRCVMPQIVACVVAGLFNIPEGLALAYSSSLIPHLMEGGDPDIHITLDQGVLIASVMVVAMCMGTFLTGLVMNRFGRLNTIRYSSVPFAVGWFLVAAASSYEEILIGRVLTGIANPLGVNSAVAFTTEVANPHIRGALNSAMTVLASGGMVIMYVLGATLHWRTAAWVCGASPFIGVLLMYFFCYESPIWLVSKGRHEEAGRSLRAYARANPTTELREKLPEQQLEWLIQKKELAASQAGGKQEPWYSTVLDLFRTPTGYKPLLLLTTVFLAQNFSGVYITLFYATTFFQEMKVSFSAFDAAIFIGLTRLVIGMLAIGLIRGVGIRKLMVGSSFGMAVCMVLSGYFTLYQEKSMGGYVPAGFVLLYVAFSCCGLLTVPWTMTAELFPDRLRDVGQSFTIFIADMLMFAGLQLYPTLMNLLQYGHITGTVGIQWFFAVVALANVVLVIFFLPETHGKSLSELEEHYEHNMLWLGRTKPDKLSDASVVVPTICTSVDAEGVTVLSTVLSAPDTTTPPAGLDARKASSDSIVSTGDSYRL